jgi:hypothetical protein
MKSAKTWVLAAAMAFMAAQPVRGQDIIPGGMYTGGSSFTLHAYVHMSYTFDAATSTYHVALTVQNLGIYGEVYKSIGLVNVPGRAVVTSPGSPSGWTYQTPNNGASLNGLPTQQYGYWVVSTAPTAGLQPGAPAVTFYFDITNIRLNQVLAMGAGVHGIAGPAGCSSKMAVLPDGNGGYTTTTQTDPNCLSTVPEPATFFLMGTGLLGLGVVGYRRRKLFAIEAEEPGVAA